MKNWLKALVEIPSPTGQEKDLQLFLEENLRRLGFETELREVAPSRPNLVAWRGQSPLLIATHSDTLPAKEYSLREEGGFFYGPGVADAKGQIAALLSVLEENRSPVTLAFTVDEEGRGEGSKNLHLPPWVKMAVVLEPTELKVAIAQAGSLDLELSIKGRKAHGACPREGDNAIIMAFEAITRIWGLNFMRTRHPILEWPHVIPYWIKGGDPELYVIPDEATIRLEVQLFPPFTPEKAITEIERAIADYGRLKVLDFDPPFEISPQAEVVKLAERAFLQALGQRVTLTGMPSWTDAEPLYHKGIEAIVLGAGKLSEAHTERERVSLEELKRLAAVLVVLLSGIADSVDWL